MPCCFSNRKWFHERATMLIYNLKVNNDSLFFTYFLIYHLIYMYVCMYKCVCTYTYMYTYICICICICVCIYMCMCMCMYMCIYIYVCMCSICICICICIYIYISVSFIFSAFLFHDPYSDFKTNTPKYEEIFSLLQPIYTVAKRCATIVAVFLNGLPEISTPCS